MSESQLSQQEDIPVRPVSREGDNDITHHELTPPISLIQSMRDHIAFPRWFSDGFMKGQNPGNHN